MRGEATSIVTKKLNKLKEIVSSKKKKALEVTAGKFVSNGSLLSQNGLKNENGGGPTNPELQNKIGGEHYQSEQQFYSKWESLLSQKFLELLCTLFENISKSLTSIFHFST